MATALPDRDTTKDIAYWGRTKEISLRESLVLNNGVPSGKAFLRIFRALDPKQPETAFRRWEAGVGLNRRQTQPRWP
jgi:hypothetical protein